MKLQNILKGSKYSLNLFAKAAIDDLEARIIDKVDKKGKPYYSVNCIIRGKEIKLTPEEVVRQLYAEMLISKYGYSKERIAFEYPICFGREAKRADIVIKDTDDANVAYIIVEVKKPKAKDGRDQLKSYTHATGASMAVWTNGTTIAYYQRQNPNFFKDIPNSRVRQKPLQRFCKPHLQCTILSGKISLPRRENRLKTLFWRWKTRYWQTLELMSLKRCSN